MNANTLRRFRLVIYVALLIQVVAIVYTLSQRPEPGLGMVIRGAALSGYTALFWLILSSEYVREMRKIFGRPFLKVHHPLGVIAWVLIVAHPMTFALQSRDLAVFVPIFFPFRSFLQWASRPALYLFALASVSAVLRRRIKGTWRFMHWLNYLAFLLVFIHASLIGTDLLSGLLRIIWTAMAGIVLIVFVHKRLGGK